jgi:acyl carrier protein
MNLNEFVTRFASEFDETPQEQFSPATVFKELNEWSSLTALSIISMIDEEFEKRVTGADMRTVSSIEDLYNLVASK